MRSFISAARPAKDLLLRGLEQFSVPRQLLDRMTEKQFVPILNLSRVSSHSNPFWPPMTPDAFHELLGRLKEQFELVLLKDVIRAKYADFARPPAVLSFDHGFADFMDHPWPIMEAHGVRANINIATDAIAAGMAPWNIGIYDLLNAATPKQLRAVRDIGIPVAFENGSDRAKRRFGARLTSFLRKRPRAERKLYLDRIEDAVDGLSAGLRTAMLKTEDIIRLDQSGFEIGCHSASHENMGFEDMAFFEVDYDRAHHWFEATLGRSFSIYAFPNGSYRTQHLQRLQRRKLDAVLLVDERLATVGQRLLPRLTISGETGRECLFQALAYRQLS